MHQLCANVLLTYLIYFSSMKIEYDCKQLVRLREEKGLEINDDLGSSMAMTKNHITALEKNDVKFYPSEKLFYTSLKKYILFLGALPQVLIKNHKELEKKIVVARTEQPNLKKSWYRKFVDNWLL
jgi:cytoskeletal protein RodZ